MKMINSTLKNKIAEGDQKAFSELFYNYFHRLFRFAYDFVKNNETAEEIVEDVFFKIWEKRERLPQIENLETYLYVAVKNHSYNFLKSPKNKLFVSISGNTYQIPDAHISPEKSLLTKELQQKIDLAIDQLPEKCRMVFNLVKEDGLKYKEVAKIMDISTKTVENQLRIALGKINDTLKSYLDKHPNKKGKQIKLSDIASLLPILLLLN